LLACPSGCGMFGDVEVYNTSRVVADEQRHGCGFPTAHWLAMMHAGSGMITKMLASPLRTHDMSHAVVLHPELHAGDVLVADRAFCSFSHLALLTQRGVHTLLRIHQRLNVDFTPKRPHAEQGRGDTNRKKGKPRSRWLRALGVTDQVVEWLKPRSGSQPEWMSVEQFTARGGSDKELVRRDPRPH
jgi:hypothetical protein